MRRANNLKRLTYVLGFLSLGVFACYFVFYFLNHFFDLALIEILFVGLIPLITVLFAFAYSAYKTEESLVKQLENENLYNFDESNHFYNRYFFDRYVTKLLKKKAYRELDAKIVAFTFANSTVSKNLVRNKTITKYMQLITHYLINSFLDSLDENKKQLPCSFAYYHGVFLFFIFGSDHDIEVLTNKIENSLFKIAEDNQINIYVQPFFGVTNVNRDGKTLISSIENAMSARNKAEKRYETINFYKEDTDMNNTSELEDIKEGIEKKEFVVYYQPKFSLEIGRFISTEALVRWNSSKYGLLPPSKFIDTASNAGLIHEIDKMVLDRVCADIRDNKLKAHRNLPVSVNFSMEEFYDNNFIDETIATCKKYNIPTSLIQIEITEATSQTNQFLASSIIKKLKKEGFKILMDDFGTGFSNIENLMLLPFDAVKLDRSYIQRIVNDPKSRDLVKFLILVCKNNNMEVIAEGVDDREQVLVLRKLGCDTIQGYYYSKPLPKVELDKFILPGGNMFEKGFRRMEEYDE